MFERLSQNMMSIVLLIVVALIIFFIAGNKVRQKKRGACSCGCSGCNGCTSNRKEEKI